MIGVSTISLRLREKDRERGAIEMDFVVGDECSIMTKSQFFVYDQIQVMA